VVEAICSSHMVWPYTPLIRKTILPGRWRKSVAQCPKETGGT